jgi:hypothetical protein
VRDALRQIRETQALLGPEFITRIKMLVRDFDSNSLVRNDQQTEEIAPIYAEKEAVDRKKNLMIVMKFLQIKQGNKSVQTQVRTLLSESKTIQ